MDFGILISILVVVGLAGIVLGPIMAGNSGNKAGSAFSNAYRQEYGSAPPEAAERAIASGTTIIMSAMGSGQYTVPGQNLNRAIRDYGAAVGWNESKMEFGLTALLLICCTKNRKVAPGCQWAADIITENIMRYCPSLSRRAMGF